MNWSHFSAQKVVFLNDKSRIRDYSPLNMNNTFAQAGQKLSHSRAFSCIGYYPLFSTQQKRKNPSCFCNEVIFIQTIRAVVTYSLNSSTCFRTDVDSKSEPIIGLVLD